MVMVHANLKGTSPVSKLLLVMCCCCCCHSLQMFFFDNPSFNNDFCSGRSCGKRSGQVFFFQPSLPREPWGSEPLGFTPQKDLEIHEVTGT